MNERFKDTRALACAVAERWYMAPGVQRVGITTNGLKGTLFLPPGRPVFIEVEAILQFGIIFLHSSQKAFNQNILSLTNLNTVSLDCPASVSVSILW